ncbi:MAG: hypothetical protein ABIA93_00960 [Candidatus Woesearchaeota archaeon]
MEIRIDTSKDSKHDIKKLISFLQHFIDAQEHELSASVPDVSPGIFGMFGDNDSKPSTYEEPKPSIDPFSDLDDKDPKSNFSIEPYD